MSTHANVPTAVLIDGENIAASDYPRLQTHLGSIAGIAIIRVFGDFAKPAHANWLEICRRHGLEPVLHCSPVTGKNGADILLTISAMDILATGTFRRIVLVSGDSDFLALVRRLRTGGVEVVGMARRASSVTSPDSYSKWIEFGDAVSAKTTKTAPLQSAPPSLPVPDGFRGAIQQIIGRNAMSLSAVGQELRKSAPAVSASLGKGKLKKRLQADDAFQLNKDSVRRRSF